MPGWHSTAPPHPQTPVALGPLPAPQPEHQSGVSSPLHGADGAPRIGKVPGGMLGLLVAAGLSPISLRCSRSGAAKLVPCGEGRISPAGIAGSICPCRHCHGTELCGARSRFQSRLFARFSSFSTSPFPPEPPRSRDPGAPRPHGEGGNVGGGHSAELGVPPTSSSTNAAVEPGAAPAAPQQPPSGPTSGRARVGTKRREEERAKVELTYRWLFKSIKGR